MEEILGFLETLFRTIVYRMTNLIDSLVNNAMYNTEQKVRNSFEEHFQKQQENEEE
ncbi:MULTISPECIES: hypothetical protein [Nostocales]|uniref:Uncharacterized protein n=3 Tax=Nostocales TaxID=1161 RepID=A0A8S9TCB6_9CYAN|nr:hypothetical protein [Tolypothrix bouteillei]KAF3889244.1 hypothetical protein DA73_0400030000 [Tolypothrix bouteillei VB521301]